MFIYEDMARAIETIYNAPPDPETGLRDFATLFKFLDYLEKLVISHASVFRLQRKFQKMAAWTYRLCEKVSRYNRPVRLKMEMLRNPAWKARVMKELGGTQALEQWDRLWEGLQAKLAESDADETGAECEIENPPDTSKDEEAFQGVGENAHETETENNRASRKAYTDSKGEFRLAPIPRPWAVPPPRAVTSMRYARQIDFYVTHPPIPLHPRELREPLPAPDAADVAAYRQYKCRVVNIDPRDYAYTLPPALWQQDDFRTAMWAKSRASPIWD